MLASQVYTLRICTCTHTRTDTHSYMRTLTEMKLEENVAATCCNLHKAFKSRRDVEMI